MAADSSRADSRRHEVVRAELTASELEALSSLLSHWARGYVRRQESSAADLGPVSRVWQIRLPDFRAAVISGATMGEPGRTREIVPHEIVADDYYAVRAAVGHVWPGLRKVRTTRSGVNLLQQAEVPHDLNIGPRHAHITRPFPCPPDKISKIVEEMLGEKLAPAEVALKLVAFRLGVGESTVKNARTKQRPSGLTVPDRTPAARIVASLYLDCTSYGPGPFPPALSARLLDVLQLAEFPPILLYYLVQSAHGLRRQISVRSPSPDIIRELHTQVGGDSAGRFQSLFSEADEHLAKP